MFKNVNQPHKYKKKPQHFTTEEWQCLAFALGFKVFDLLFKFIFVRNYKNPKKHFYQRWL